MKSNMKKILSLLLVLILVFALAACGNTTEDEKDPAQAGEITVVSREEGSGTRGAFIELTGVEQKEKDEEGNEIKVDKTVETAEFQNGTGNVINFVKGDDKAIGYISLGSVDTSVVKPLKIDGVDATEENVLSGDYKIQRPFLFVFKSEEELSPAAKDFLAFALSKEGQEIAVESGYVTVDVNAKPYEKAADAEGEVTLTGSTSVKPLADKLIEKYAELNDKVTVTIPAATGSGAGIEEASQGKNDIGMSSRDLKDSEAEKLQKKAIAMDGIAVIVSPENPVEGLSMESLQGIYTGTITKWEDVK
ncbi:MAG: substrate-binding domain-containing protein [Tissierellia bacterium]|nr:substrate-binding domain-containing protein [Tissierellia bacterium]